MYVFRYEGLQYVPKQLSFSNARSTLHLHEAVGGNLVGNLAWSQGPSFGTQAKSCPSQVWNIKSKLKGDNDKCLRNANLDGEKSPTEPFCVPSSLYSASPSLIFIKGYLGGNKKSRLHRGFCPRVQDPEELQ
jgi:hypothetical protein